MKKDNAKKEARPVYPELTNFGNAIHTHVINKNEATSLVQQMKFDDPAFTAKKLADTNPVTYKKIFTAIQSEDPDGEVKLSSAA